jgi:tRNA uridine 5-carboxymethylaminomethyl modification enzyme
MSIGESKKHPYDVIVCGAGHAGCEAALASARSGSKTLILTGNLDTIAQMSCNPAIGGQAKGQIVREIDALGGEMALNTDFSAIQYKLLNTSKGPAVQAPRAQCDKKRYQLRMKHVLEQYDNLEIFQSLVTGLIVNNNQCAGVKTSLIWIFTGKLLLLPLVHFCVLSARR